MASELAKLNVRLQLQNQQFLQKLERSNKKIESFARKSNRSLESFKSSAVGSFRAVSVAVGALGLVRIGTGIVSVASSFETLKISLKTVTGSAEDAAKAFSLIERFTKETPFQLEEVTQGFIKLQARGLDPSANALRSYGNIAAGMSKSLDQVIEAVADAATGEFERLKEFGINAKTQGEQITFTFRGVSTVIRKEASAIEGYLKGIGDVEFGGAMADQMETLAGRTSNLKDALATLADKFANESGLMTGLKNFTSLLTDAVKTLTGDNIEFSGLQFLDEQIDTTVEKMKTLNDSVKEGGLSKLNTEKAILELQSLGRQYARLKETRDEFISQGADTTIGTPGAPAAPAIKAPPGLTDSEKAFNKWKSTVIDVGRETEALQQKIDFLDESLLAGTLTTEEHRIELEKLTGAQSVHVGEVEKSLEKASDKVAEVSRGAIDMGFAFTSAFEDAVLGGEAFSDVLDGLLKDLQKVALRQLITAPAGNALSAGISRTFPGFASGGSFTVGGSGGTDSQLVAFNATPGERVAVSTPGHQVGSTTVNVINNSGAQTEVKRSNDGSGRELINVIIGQVAQSISSGGQVAQAMQGVFGVRRQGILRT